MENTIFKSGKNSVMKSFRVALIIVAGLLMAGAASATSYYVYYNNTAQKSCWEDNSSFQWMTGALTPDGNGDITFTINARLYENYLYISTSQNVSDIINFINQSDGVTYTDASSLLYRAEKCECGNYKGMMFNTKAAGNITIMYNVNTKAFTFLSSVTQYTVTTSVTGGVASPANPVVNQGSSVDITITPTEDGYVYSTHSLTASTGSVVRDGNVFTVTPTANTTLSVTYVKQSFTVYAEAGSHGSVTPASQSVNYGENSSAFTASPDDGYAIDQTNTTFTGVATIEYSGNAITLKNVTKAGTLNVEFKSSSVETPIVHFGALPTQSGNSVNVGAYLVERYCNAIEAAGFYWNTTADVTLDDTKKISATTAPAHNGDSFSGTFADLDDVIASGKNIFFKAYVTTSAGTGYSDVVGIFFTPCSGIESVSIVPSSDPYTMAEGRTQEFQTVARSAGKTPSYQWKLGGVDIAGAQSDTYTFTKGSGDQTLSVYVSETECGSDDNASLTITPCNAPTVLLSFNDDFKGTTNPWTSVSITAATTNMSSYEWSVDNGAELSSLSGTSATFRAGVVSGDQTIYTVTYTAKSDCTSETITTGTIKITVVKDQESCNQ